MVGQRLKVPGSAAAAPAAEPVFHVVQKGEWLTRIAQQYGVSPADVCR
ncbi:MAG: LysM domain-containing protein [Myxococcota bacterium]